MRTYTVAFLAALIAAALLTPLARRLALRVGAVSHPGGRNVHLSVVPRLGGIAIYGAFMLPVAALLFVDSSVGHIIRTDSWKVAGLLVGSTAAAVVGLADDTRGVGAVLKFGLQIGVAAFAFSCGYRIDAVTLPFFGNLSMGIFAFPVTVLWITGIVNAVNLIDGLDGLAGGVVLFAALTNFVIANIGGSVFIAVVMAATIGAVLGFLIFNFNPARIFMGDTGSYFLGYVLATSALVGGTTSQKASTAVSLLVPCLALGVPIFDTLFSMFRRFLERRPLFSADRGHIHHRLLDMGLTHRRAVLTIYAASAAFSIAAIAASFGKDWQVGVALLASSTVLFALVRAAGYFEYLRLHLRRPGRSPCPRMEKIRRALPRLGERLALSTNEGQVREALDELARTLPFERLTITERRPDAPRPRQSSRAVDVFEVSYPIGHDDLARGDVLFAWSADEGPLTPAMDVVLEILVDMVEYALLRVGSHLAPAASVTTTNAATSSSEPAPVGVTPSTFGSR